MTGNHNSLPTLKEIWAAHGWKRDYEKYLLLSRFIFRPIGFLLTWVAIRARLTSEAVSWMSGAIGLAAYILLVSGDVELLPLGLATLLFFNLLDCVDGSLARTMKTENPYGTFLDSICGGALDLAFWAIIGIMAFQHQQFLFSPMAFGCGPLLWLAIGISTCYLAIFVGYTERTYAELLKADWDKVHSSNLKEQTSKPKTIKFRKRPALLAETSMKGKIRIINNNLRVRETHYFFVISAFYTRMIDCFLILYFIYYLLHSILLFIIYSERGKIIRNNYISRT